MSIAIYRDHVRDLASLSCWRAQLRRTKVRRTLEVRCTFCQFGVLTFPIL